VKFPMPSCGHIDGAPISPFLVKEKSCRQRQADLIRPLRRAYSRNDRAAVLALFSDLSGPMCAAKGGGGERRKPAASISPGLAYASLLARPHPPSSLLRGLLRQRPKAPGPQSLAPWVTGRATWAVTQDFRKQLHRIASHSSEPAAGEGMRPVSAEPTAVTEASCWRTPAPQRWSGGQPCFASNGPLTCDQDSRRTRVAHWPSNRDSPWLILNLHTHPGADFEQTACKATPATR